MPRKTGKNLSCRNFGGGEEIGIFGQNIHPCRQWDKTDIATWSLSHGKGGWLNATNIRCEYLTERIFQPAQFLFSILASLISPWTPRKTDIPMKHTQEMKSILLDSTLFTFFLPKISRQTNITWFQGCPIGLDHHQGLREQYPENVQQSLF